MNTPSDHDAGDRDAREWAAQERALRHARAAAVKSPGPSDCRSGFSRELLPAAERSSASPHDAGEALYRHVAEALRRPPTVDLPRDFAARVARIAELQASVRGSESSRLKPLLQSGAFERALVRALVATFALCTLLAGAIYGERVLTQLQATVGVHGLQWAALAATCLGLSWILDWLRRRLGHGDAMRAA